MLSQSGLRLNHIPVLMAVKQDIYSPKGSTHNERLSRHDVEKLEISRFLYCDLKACITYRFLEKNLFSKRNPQVQMLRTKHFDFKKSNLMYPVVLFSVWVV